MDDNSKQYYVYVLKPNQTILPDIIFAFMCHNVRL